MSHLIMRSLILCLIGISHIFPTFGEVQHEHQVIKIKSLAQIPDNNPPETLIFFDIDDTLLDSTHMLGSKAWRRYIQEATKHDSSYNWHDNLTFYIAQNYPMKPVETITQQYVHQLIQKGFAAFGLTARERKMWHDTPKNDVDALTISQLKSIGIDLSQNPGNIPYSSLTTAPEYYEGVFFADLEPKGHYLLKLFKDADHLPKKIIFIDDKQSQAVSVSAALTQLGIEHECYWYVATEEKNLLFDPLIANIQLCYFWTSHCQVVLSDQKAASIADEHPEIDAKDYLKAVFNDKTLQLQTQL